MFRVRLVVYAIAIAYFGYQAIQRWSAASDEPAKDAASELPKPTRRYQLPDGTTVPVYELTPAQAEKLMGVPREEAAADSHEAAKPAAEPQADADAPAK